MKKSKKSEKNEKGEGVGAPDHTKFTGDLDRPIQVNFTTAQKDRLIEKSAELGVPLATFIRLKVLESIGEK